MAIFTIHGEESFVFFFHLLINVPFNHCSLTAFKFAEIFLSWKKELELDLSSHKAHGLFVVATTTDRDDLSSLLQVLFPRHISVGSLSSDDRFNITG